MAFSITCDFDGTITLADTVNALLHDFALPEWVEIEADWCAGKFGSRRCLAEQTALLRIAPRTLDAYLDAVPVDPDVKGFFDECRTRSIPISVVSDGYDWAVRRVLARIGATDAPIVANRLVHVGGDRWTVLFPHAAPTCSGGVCKCAATDAQGVRVHIGDGRSDLCVSDLAEVVFAKGWLLESRTARGLNSLPFERFADIRARLPDLGELTAIPASLAARRSA